MLTCAHARGPPDLSATPSANSSASPIPSPIPSPTQARALKPKPKLKRTIGRPRLARIDTQRDRLQRRWVAPGPPVGHLLSSLVNRLSCPPTRMRPILLRLPPRPAIVACLLLTPLLLAGCLRATGGYRDTPFKPDAEPPTPKSVQERSKWAEGDYTLPAWPQDTDLLKIKLDGPQQPFTYFMDQRSLQTGSDGVVRYTLVTESSSGSRNVSFEGLRCTPQGYWTTYAYGANGAFTPIPAAGTWFSVDKVGRDQLHYDLWRHYLCVHLAFQPRPKAEQVHLLRSGRVPKVETMGFLPD